MSAFLSGFLGAPAFLGFLGLVPVVVLLYLLKLRRTEVVIPSTMLWMKSLHDLTANAPFQRLRSNLLLFLQILILILLALALARPFMTREGAPGSSLCLIIDRSASMQTIEGVDGLRKSRLDLAKERALELLDGLSRSDRVMVVAFAETAEVLCELTEDRRRARRAIDALSTTDTRTAIRDVTQIINSLSPDNPDITSVIPGLEVVLLSDGRLGDPDALGGLSVAMRFVQVGETVDNVGVVEFNLRESPGDPDERQAFVLLQNAADTVRTATLTLYHEEEPGAQGTAMAVEETRICAGEAQEVIFALPALDHGLLRVEIDEADQLAVDNRAWVALRPAVALEALVVSEADSVSGQVLARVLSLEPRVKLTMATPDTYDPGAAHHMTLFDGWAPDDLPGGTLVFINTVPAVNGLRATGELENPPALSTQRDHPLMRYINVGNLRVAKAAALALPEGATALVSSENDAPLVADLSHAGQQMILIAFDLAESNWPLQLSFPVFMQNLLYWTPVGALVGESALATGEPLELSPIPGVEEAVVRRPDGGKDRVRMDPVRPSVYGGTSAAGPYAVTRGEQVDLYAANLLDHTESDIRPVSELQVGKSTVTAETGTLRYHYELWPWLVVFSLAVLALEWWIYSRRAFG